MVLIEHLFYLFFSCTTFPLTHTNTSCDSWLLSQTNNASFVVLSLSSTLWAPLPSLLARFPRQKMPIRPSWTGHTPPPYTPATHVCAITAQRGKSPQARGVLLICYIEPIRGGEVRIITLRRVGMGKLWEKNSVKTLMSPTPRYIFSSLFTHVTLVRWTVSQVCLFFCCLVFRLNLCSGTLKSPHKGRKETAVFVSLTGAQKW